MVRRGADLGNVLTRLAQMMKVILGLYFGPNVAAACLTASTSILHCQRGVSKHHILGDRHVLALRDAVAEEEDALRLGATLLLEDRDVLAHHVDKVGNDFDAALLEADADREADILAIRASDGDSDRGLDKAAVAGRRVRTVVSSISSEVLHVSPNHHGCLVELERQQGKRKRRTVPAMSTSWVTPPSLAWIFIATAVEHAHSHTHRCRSTGQGHAPS